MTNPLFSIVIPTYNRAETIERCLNSVIGQDFKDYEIVIVDDASTDTTIDVIKKFKIKKLIIVQHKINRGIGPSRNSGIAASSGSWIFPLDSDDELAPGILQKISEIINNVDDSIKRIRGSVKLDDGTISPVPYLTNEVWDYERYIISLNKPANLPSESCSCFKKEALLQVPYQQGRTLETLFHLDFFKNFKVLNTNFVFRLYHNDAVINTRKGYSVNDILRDAADNAEMVDTILERHGNALIKWAPYYYYLQVHNGVKYHLLCGNRSRAIRLFSIGLRMPTWRLLAYLAFGLINPSLLAYININYKNLFLIKSNRHKKYMGDNL